MHKGLRLELLTRIGIKDPILLRIISNEHSIWFVLPYLYLYVYNFRIIRTGMRSQVFCTYLISVVSTGTYSTLEICDSKE